MSDDNGDDVDYVKCNNEFAYKGKIYNGYTTVELLKQAEEFEFLPTDIVVATFPRSGTTFTLEIVWQIMNRSETIKGGEYSAYYERTYFLELKSDFCKNYMNVAESRKSDPYRILKTHLSYSLLKHNLERIKPKLIFVMRNAKDCLVSNYHFYDQVSLNDWKGTFNDYYHIFYHGKTYTGSYFDNNLEWWRLRDQENVLILKYEELLSDLDGNVRKVAQFLNQQVTDEDVDKIVYNSSFSTMSKNEKMNFKAGKNLNFLRKGQMGDWKNYLSKEQDEKLSKKIKQKFDNDDLTFIYE